MSGYSITNQETLLSDTTHIGDKSESADNADVLGHSPVLCTNEVDILENDIIDSLGEEVLDILLADRSVTATRNDGKVYHIFWATYDYERLGEGYGYFDEIMAESITGEHNNIIMPRVLKNKRTQTERVKKMAEVFTPSWVCNMMINNVDEKWFGRKNVFNEESDDHKVWTTIHDRIMFPEGKTWMDYVRHRRMEITCGEGPFMTSRYDATTGFAIATDNRIGMIDRKLRVISENVDDSAMWLKWAQEAYQNILAYEWQGDNLLLARESLLYTFIDYYKAKFGRQPQRRSIKTIATIISWNVWQMDGLKGVVPMSCHDIETTNLYGETETSPCPGCKSKNFNLHNGIPCLVMHWPSGVAYKYSVMRNKTK